MIYDVQPHSREMMFNHIQEKIESLGEEDATDTAAEAKYFIDSVSFMQFLLYSAIPRH